jgi:hypothetical protein
LDAKVDAEVNSLHVKRIDIDDLVGYVYIVRVDKQYALYKLRKMAEKSNFALYKLQG